MAAADDTDATAPTAPRISGVDPDDLALIGKRLGEYRVDGIVGAGGMGLVFRGEQPVIKKKVAIKVLKRALVGEGRSASRMLEEARVANAVSHPGIVDIIGFGQVSDGRPYLVMEFLEGEPLDVRLASRGKLAPVAALRLLVDLLAPLEAAHAGGVIHRDLKPGNVFLQRLSAEKELPKLLDFGLARFVDATARNSGIVGTPFYMAPEQAKDGDLTSAVDLYALGCIAYELFSGRPPFEGATAWEVIEKQLNGKERPLTSMVLGLDDEVADFVHELLAKDPAKRPTATQARREAARLLRAREDAATVTVPQVRPSTKDATALEPAVDAREAPTVLGLSGVAASPVKPRASRIRADQRKTSVDGSAPVAPPSATAMEDEVSLDVPPRGKGALVIAVLLGLGLLAAAVWHFGT